MKTDDIKRFIAKTRQVCDKATAGPWEQWKGHGNVNTGPSAENNEGCYRWAKGSIDIEICDCCDFDNPKYKADAKYIATSRTALPTALDTIEQLLAQVEMLSKALKLACYEMWRYADIASLTDCFCDKCSAKDYCETDNTVDCIEEMCKQFKIIAGGKQNV